VIRWNQSQATSRNGFERDARNSRPEACATRMILKTRPGHHSQPQAYTEWAERYSEGVAWQSRVKTRLK
jgi:hypothetical protein